MRGRWLATIVLMFLFTACSFGAFPETDITLTKTGTGLLLTVVNESDQAIRIEAISVIDSQNGAVVKSSEDYPEGWFPLTLGAKGKWEFSIETDVSRGHLASAVLTVEGRTQSVQASYLPE